MDKQAESVVEIDELNLDKECIRLPSDYLRWATKSAEARQRSEQAKAKLDLVEAEVSRRVRDNPGKYGLEKPTIDAVKAAVQCDAKFQEAAAEVSDAKHEAELCQAVVWALEHKKKALTLLVDLHGMSYSASVRPSREGKEAVERMTQERVRRPVSRREREERDDE